MSSRDGSDALGAPELAGSFVNPRGLVRKVGAASARPVVAAHADAQEAPRFGRVGYLSLTRDEIAIVRARAGGLRAKITDQALARVDRSAIAGVGFEGGTLLSHLTISFRNGIVWEFDIPRVNKRTAELVVSELERR